MQGDSLLYFVFGEFDTVRNNTGFLIFQILLVARMRYEIPLGNLVFIFHALGKLPVIQKALKNLTSA